MSTDVPWDVASVLHCLRPCSLPSDTYPHTHTDTGPSHTHTHTHWHGPVPHTGTHTATPSAAGQHLNLRAIPARLLNTTDWDEWQTSRASISPLILLVGQLAHIRYSPPTPPAGPAAAGLREPCVASKTRSGVLVAQHAGTTGTHTGKMSVWIQAAAVAASLPHHCVFSQ